MQWKALLWEIKYLLLYFQVLTLSLELRSPALAFHHVQHKYLMKEEQTLNVLYLTGHYQIKMSIYLPYFAFAVLHAFVPQIIITYGSKKLM